MFNFEKLDVWHKAIEFADSVYTVTEKFPDAERYGLTSQMRRAAVSLPTNKAAEEESRMLIGLSWNHAVHSGWNGQPGRSRRQLAAELGPANSLTRPLIAVTVKSAGRVARHNGPVARSTILPTTFFRL